MTDAHTARRVVGRGRGTRAFTLIEVLVAISIIAVLAALSLVVGSKVLQGSKKNLTADTIRVLDASLGTFRAQEDSNPSAFAYHPGEQQRYLRGDTDIDSQDEVPLIPVADARWDSNDTLINSVGLFLSQGEEKGISLASGLDSRLVRVYTPAGGSFPELTTVFDAWDRPMRFVHPKFDGQIVDGTRARGNAGSYLDITDEDEGFVFGLTGAEWLAPGGGGTGTFSLRRNAIQEGEVAVPVDQRDADGGVCISNQPYFYSAGPDGDPSTTEDNVYTTVPTFVELDL